MMGGLEAVLIPVASELLRNAAVSAVKFFRDRGRADDDAREEAKEKLAVTRGNVESAVEDIIGSALPEERKAEFKHLVEESVSQLPIQEGLAIVTIARYCEMPVYRVQQTEEWMLDPTLVRTATNHAWVERQCEQCLIRLGYGIEKGRQLREGVVNLWADIMAKIPREPSHRVAVDIVCSPDPNDHRVAAFLYDMETANILQQGDWFFLATHGLFNEFVKGIVQRARGTAPYAIATLEAPQIQSMMEAQEDPAKLYGVLQSLILE